MARTRESLSPHPPAAAEPIREARTLVTPIFRYRAPVSSDTGVSSRAALEYEETVSTPAGVKKLPFRLEEGQFGFEATLALLRQNEALEAELDRVRGELEVLRGRKGGG